MRNVRQAIDNAAECLERAKEALEAGESDNLGDALVDAFRATHRALKAYHARSPTPGAQAEEIDHG